LDWTARVNNYCERLGPDFWAEPLNASSNLAFVAAAMAALLLWRRKSPDDWPVLALIMVVLATGIGSFLFHTVATRWAMLADVIPIAVFIHTYLALALRRLLAMSWLLICLCVAGFLALSPALSWFAAPLVGASAGYLPALLAIFGVGLAVWRRDRLSGQWLVSTGAVFSLSLALRTLDAPLCAAWPAGTHFLWHILNGVVLFSLLRLLIWRRAGYTH
jgi:hypothetical protein